MKNLKKIFLTTFALSLLTGITCNGMYSSGGQAIQAYVQGEYLQLLNLHTKFNSIVNYLKTLDKIVPTSEAAQKIASILLINIKETSSYGYKEKIKDLADYLKQQNIISEEEYNQFKILINW